MRKIREEGAEFRSHLDGSLHLLTPEKATDIQAQLGSDIAMVLDECVSSTEAIDSIRQAMLRSARWAARCRERLLRLRDSGVDGVTVTNPGQAQFGIVQGGVHPGLRTESVQATVEIGFEAYAIGGLSVGEPPEVMYDVVGHTAPQLPVDRPRYLMGTGMPDDLVECVARGIDLFDCVLPTRNARNGQLITSKGLLVIKNARFAEDQRPPDESCGCYTCRHFSRAYLRHLYIAGEMTAATLNSIHNLYCYLDLMRRIREAIVFGSFERLRQEFHQTFSRRTLQ
jgi:queuine tRNA-ribosyltransferase